MRGLLVGLLLLGAGVVRAQEGEEWPQPAGREWRDPAAEPEAPPAERPFEEPEPLPPAPPEEAPPAGKARGGATPPRAFGLSLDLYGMHLESKFEKEGPGGLGNELVFGRQLPAERDGGALEARAWVGLARHWRLDARWLGMTTQGHAGGVKGFIHDGVSFPTATPLRTRVDLQMVALGACMAAIDDDDAQAGLTFGVLWLTERLEVHDRASVRRASARNEAWTPYIGFRGAWRLGDHLWLELEARTFAHPVGRYYHAAFFDVDVKVAYEITKNIRLRTGPKLFTFDHHAKYSNRKEVHMDASLIGWAIGLEVAF